MKVAVGCDHAGLPLKETVMAELRGRDLQVLDCGTQGPASVDYPDFASAVAGMVSRGEADRGVLMCGTGIGMSMVANRFAGVRAAVVHDEFTTEMSRRHNDANVICLGGRVLDAAGAARLVRLWLETPFEGGRHRRRVDKIDAAGTRSAPGGRGA
jgi:ribose 5-phosphate isomerase B